MLNVLDEIILSKNTYSPLKRINKQLTDVDNKEKEQNIDKNESYGPQSSSSSMASL